jgi:hypothetical protein
MCPKNRIRIKFQLCLLLSAVAWALSVSPGYSLNVGRCFSGGCDLAWELNKRFDKGLQSKSEAIAEPFKQAYFEIANDLFNAKIAPLIDDIDVRVKGRINDISQLVSQAEKAIDLSIEAAANAADKELKQISAIEDKAKHDIDDIIRQINDVIDNAECAAYNVVDDVRKLITIDFSLVHTDSCYVERGFRFSAPRDDDDVTKFRIRQCQLEKDLEGSQTVKDILDNISRLSELSRQTACILRKTTGSALAADEERRYQQLFSIWYLTLNKQ